MPSSAPPRSSATSITSSEAMSSWRVWVRRRRHAEPARQRHWLYRSPPVRPVWSTPRTHWRVTHSCPTDHRTWGSPCRGTPTGCQSLCAAPPRDPSYQIRAPERPVPVAAPLAGSDVYGRVPLRRARRGRRATACEKHIRHASAPEYRVSGRWVMRSLHMGRRSVQQDAEVLGPARALVTARDDALRIGRQLGGEATRQQSAGLPGSPPRTGYGRSVSSATCLGDGFPGRRRRCAA